MRRTSCRVPPLQTVDAVLSRPTPDSMHARRLGSGQQQPREGPATASPRPTPRDPRRPTARAPHVAVISAQTRGPVTPPRHDDGLPTQTERGSAGPSVSTSMGSGPAETYQPPSATAGGTTGTDALNQRPRRAKGDRAAPTGCLRSRGQGRLRALPPHDQTGGTPPGRSSRTEPAARGPQLRHAAVCPPAAAWSVAGIPRPAPHTRCGQWRPATANHRRSEAIRNAGGAVANLWGRTRLVALTWTFCGPRALGQSFAGARRRHRQATSSRKTPTGIDTRGGDRSAAPPSPVPRVWLKPGGHSRAGPRSAAPPTKGRGALPRFFPGIE